MHVIKHNYNINNNRFLKCIKNFVSEIVYRCYTIRIHSSPRSCCMGEPHILGISVLPRRTEGHPAAVRTLVRGAHYGTLEFGGVEVASCEHTEHKTALV